MVPIPEGAPSSSPCRVMSYVLTKVWNKEAHRVAFSNMVCKPAGFVEGERAFRIRADFTARSGIHYKFAATVTASGYVIETEQTRARP